MNLGYARPRAVCERGLPRVVEPEQSAVTECGGIKNGACKPHVKDQSAGETKTGIGSVSYMTGIGAVDDDCTFAS